MDIVDLSLRLLHIAPAIFLAGGVFFMWLALVPALGTLPEETRASVLTAVSGKWSKVVMASSGLLLATGIVNAVRIIKAYEFSGMPPYHALVLVKLLLALAIMFITARLSGRSQGAERFREKISFWMTVNSVLLLVLILTACVMRVSDRTEKIDTPTAQLITVDNAHENVVVR